MRYTQVRNVLDQFVERAVFENLIEMEEAESRALALSDLGVTDI
jgi:hypothetical protein